MPEDPNRLLRFWQELKRRKVIRVSAMYAATAFIIIEAGDIVLPRLGLPDWTVTLLIVLLIAGFPIAVILSWIFDVTPEGIEKTEFLDHRPAGEVMPSKKKKKRKLKASDAIIAVLLLVVLILLYPKIFKPDRIEQFRSDGEISVAVMPFQNLTSDTLKNFWQEMVQDNLISVLSNSEVLKVRQTETINILLEHTDVKNYASLTPSMASQVSQKLDAGVFIYGSISQTGETIRLNAKLVDSETEVVFKSFQVDGTAADILYVSDSLSSQVQDYLIVNILQEEIPPDFRSLFGKTENPEALRYMIEGQKIFAQKDYAEACRMFHRAIEIDSNYVNAYLFLATAYNNRGLAKEAKKWVLKGYEFREEVSRLERILIDYTYSILFGTPADLIKYARQVLEIDDQQAVMYYNLGQDLHYISRYEEAVSAHEKALELYEKWGIRPVWVNNYTELGMAYHELGMFRKERKLYRTAEKDFPGSAALISRQAILALAEGRTADASEYMEKFVSILEKRSYSEAAVNAYIGRIYWSAEMPRKAEKYYRLALELEPERAYRLNNLAFLLINEELNVEEGLKLVEKALESAPDHYNYLDTRGWGLYKQGRYEEAVEVLEQAWELKPRYNHGIFLHLEEARKALAGPRANK